MKDNKQFAAELIGQEGLVPGQLSDLERQEIRTMLDVQWRRARRMKWITIGSWILVACCLAVFGSLEAAWRGAAPPWLAAAVFATRGLVFVAGIMTVSYYARYRAASMSEMRVRLAEIEAKLQQIAGR